MFGRFNVILAPCVLMLSTPAMNAAPAAESAASRPQIPWDLTDLYPTLEAWEEARQSVAQGIQELPTFRGKLGDGAGTLADLLERVYGLSQQVARISVYASLEADENLRDATTMERRTLAQELSMQLGRAISWMNPELLALGDDRIYSYLEKEPRLAPYRFPIEQTLRLRPHILGEEAERVMSASGLALGTGSRVHGILTNSDLPWPKLTLSTGEEVTLDAAGYNKHRSSPNREDRKRVFDAFWSAYRTYENTFGTTLAGQVQTDVFQMRARNHRSTLAAALSGRRVPEEVYRTLLAEVDQSLPTLHRYFRLQARMLGIEQPHYYDIYADVVKLDRTFPYEEGRRLTIESAAPLGPEYVADLRRALTSPWTHVYPQPGKRAGAYMSGGAYDVHPYVLMNYQDDFESVSTLAHEWGHGLHSMLANRHQPYPTAAYPIFTAEIASVVNEVLLFEHLLQEAQTDDERLFYLGAALERTRATYYRQAMFAEFELKMREVVEQGGALSGRRLTALYSELLKRHHGHDQGVVKIDDLYTIEWAHIPHFYRGYYVFQYATSLAAANLFAERILAGEPGARETYLGLLRAGGSDYPYELVKRAGVDLASPAPTGPRPLAWSA
jgi:oligoendopeptidase F